jgi:hypothetical protein
MNKSYVEEIPLCFYITEHVSLPVGQVSTSPKPVSNSIVVMGLILSH